MTTFVGAAANSEGSAASRRSGDPVLSSSSETSRWLQGLARMVRQYEESERVAIRLRVIDEISPDLARIARALQQPHLLRIRKPPFIAWRRVGRKGRALELAGGTFRLNPFGVRS